jgi:hypothetical protein
MRKLLIATAIVLAACGSACAKVYVFVSVQISDEKIKQQLQDAVEARINSTERYTVTGNAMETDLVLKVTCLALGEGSEIACDSEVGYFPYRSALSVPVEGAESMAVSPLDNTGYIANSLMNHFINGTTDAILEERKSFLRKAIRLFCAIEPTECKMPLR